MRIGSIALFVFVVVLFGFRLVCWTSKMLYSADAYVMLFAFLFSQHILQARMDWCLVLSWRTVVVGWREVFGAQCR